MTSRDLPLPAARDLRDLDPEAARAAATLAGITSGTSQAFRGQCGQVIPGETARVLGTLHFILY